MTDDAKDPHSELFWQFLRLRTALEFICGHMEAAKGKTDYERMIRIARRALAEANG